MKKNLLGFTLVELLVSITIIGILASIGLNTFTSAQKKSRDAERKAHLKQLRDSFEAYYNDHGQYPDSADITWDSSFTDANGTVYMVKLPADPTLGYSYLYEPVTENSRITKFQIYSRLENTKDIDIPKNQSGASLIYSDILCGTLNCNYGTSSSNISVSENRTISYE